MPPYQSHQAPARSTTKRPSRFIKDPIKMPTGSCMCGHVTMTYDSEPAMKALCHCVDCQKISGGSNSVNMVIQDDTFKWTGQTPKTFAKQADSGKQITSFFCGDCGTTLARTTPSFPNMVIIKAGVVDGGIELAKPGAELYTSQRASWIPAISDAQQMKTME